MARSAEHARIEKAAFNAFLEACPQFAAVVEDWSQPEAHFPGIALKLKGGQAIDVELVEWLHQAQMAAGRRRESLEEHLVAALGQLPDNSTRNVRFLLLEPHEPTHRFDAKDAQSFRSELFELIAEIDSQYDRDHRWFARHQYSHREFRKYPVLGKYLLSVLFDWREVDGEAKEAYPKGIPWIEVAPTGGSYDPNDALGALLKIIDDKVSKYGKLPDGTRLLIHYGRGWIYNTPFRGINIRSFDDVGRWASQALAGRTIPFAQVYLVEAFEEPAPAAFQIYPTLVRGADVRV